LTFCCIIKHSESITCRPLTQIQDPESKIQNSLLSSFGYAYQGISYTFRTQRNFRIHIALALLATLLGLWLGLSWGEWAVLALTVTLVLVAEMTNTMIESLVDLVTQEYHPLAKVAKDVSAGIVLVTAIGAAAIGVFLFLPKLLEAL
jgi:undecaprenol kinase